MKREILAWFFCGLSLQGDAPKKFAGTLNDLLQGSFTKLNAGPSEAAVLPVEGPYQSFNNDDTRLPAVTRALSKPIEMPLMTLEVAEQAGAAKGSLLALCKTALSWSGESAPELDAEPKSETADDEEALIQSFADMEIEAGRIPDDAFRLQLQTQLASVPRSLKRALADTLSAMLRASKAVTESHAALSEEENAHLLSKGIAFGTPDQEEQESDLLDTSKIFWKKFSRAKMSAAAMDLARSVEKLIAACATPAIVKPAPLLFERETPLGWVLLGGKDKNEYNKDAALIVDLGGDDSYKNNAGGSASVPGRVAVVVDIAGNDKYENKKDYVQGCGALGIGFLIDLVGNDSYSAGNFSQGCGVFGVGLLFDKAGNDKYEAGGLAQGAGEFGLGLLEDEAGDDEFKTTICGQGYGGAGGVGALIDYKGNDRYVAGRKYPDTARDKSKFLSMSQGFGFGNRFAKTEKNSLTLTGSIPGGVGILLDQAGDDLYESEIFGQGSGYWYSLGMLIDMNGNDRYKSWRYAQGAGTHLAAGILADYNGNDGYSSWGVSQACAHDYSAAILLDYAGNDTYRCDTLAQGASNALGSFALLVDRAGDDSYACGDANNACWGGVSPTEFEKEFKPASYAFFYDLAGKDTYKGGKLMKDGASLVDTNFELGLGVDKP